MEIKLAKEMHGNINEKISELFVEAFGKDLKIISKDANKIIRAFSHMFVLDYFYVGIIDNEIAGMMVCIDINHCRDCFNQNKKILIKELGFVKGLLANMIIDKYINNYPRYPFNVEGKIGSIETVATNKNFRKKGIATKIMEYIFSLNMYEKYILEVEDTNESAYNLYKKLGYKEYYKVKSKNGKKNGINYLIYMVKE